MRIQSDTLLTLTLVICALVTTVLVVRREIIVSHNPSAQAPSQEPVFVDEWKSLLEKGERRGPLNAPVKLVEFADFECPFCASFQKPLRALMTRYPTQVSITYIHFPLEMHRFAVPAARVAECAGEQGRFEAMHDRLFDGQAAFGLKPWRDYATEAGVAELDAFEQCTKRETPVARIEVGKQLAEKLNVRSVPTVIINGWKLTHPPTLEELDRMVTDVLSGRAPVTHNNENR